MFTYVFVHVINQIRSSIQSFEWASNTFGGGGVKDDWQNLCLPRCLLFGSQTCTNPFPFSFLPSPAPHALQATKDFDAGDIRIAHKWRSYNGNNDNWDSMQFCSSWRLYSSQGVKAFHGIITRYCSKKRRLIFGNCWRGYLTRTQKEWERICTSLGAKQRHWGKHKFCQSSFTPPPPKVFDAHSKDCIELLIWLITCTNTYVNILPCPVTSET